MSLTRADIAEHLIIKYKFPKTFASEFVDDFFEVISQSLEDGESVKLTGFGNFDVKDKVARPGRNPRTGKAVMIEARRVATFKVGQKLRGRISEACNKDEAKS